MTGRPSFVASIGAVLALGACTRIAHRKERSRALPIAPSASDAGVAVPLRTLYRGALPAGFDLAEIAGLRSGRREVVVTFHDVRDDDTLGVETIDLARGRVLDDWQPKILGRLAAADWVSGKLGGYDLSSPAVASELDRAAVHMAGAQAVVDTPLVQVAAGSGRIAYQGGDYIFVADAAGGGSRVVGTSGASYAPIFSPDGTRLAYTACERPCGDYFLRIVPADLSTPPVTVRATGAVTPASERWSRDGAYLYVRTEGAGEAYGHDLGGCVARVTTVRPSEVKNLACRPGRADLGFAQSPDGRSALVWTDDLPRATAHAPWPEPRRTELTWIGLPDGAARAHADLPPIDDLGMDAPLGDTGLVLVELGYGRVGTLEAIDMTSRRTGMLAIGRRTTLLPGPWLDDRRLLAVREPPGRAWELVQIDVGAILAGSPR